MIVEERANGEAHGFAREWDELAERTSAPPFLRPGWFEAFWRCFEPGSPHAITARDDGGLTGVAPLASTRWTLRSATNAHTPVFGFLAAGDEAVRALADLVLSIRRPHVEITHLEPADPAAGALLERAPRAGYHVDLEWTTAAPYVSIEGTFQEYETCLRKKLVTELRRRRRRLEEMGDLRLEVADGSSDLDALLAEGYDVEGSGWKGRGGTSISSQRPTRRFYTEIARWATERGWLRLAFLRLNDVPIAFDYGLECCGTHYLLKTGYDESLARYAPGMIMRRLMLERAFSLGLNTYDFLGEDYTWKREFTGASRERVSLQMYSYSAHGAALRAKSAASRGMEKALRATVERGFGQGGVDAARRARGAVRRFRGS